MRVAIATAFAVAPDRTMRELFGQDARTSTRRWVARHDVVRDAVLGVVLAHALRNGNGRPEVWMLLGGVADLVDAGAVTATGAHQRTWPTTPRMSNAAWRRASSGGSRTITGRGGPDGRRFVGGDVPFALRTTAAMAEITVGKHSAFQVPVLGFRGTPTGIDVIAVLRTGILPQITTDTAGWPAGSPARAARQGTGTCALLRPRSSHLATAVGRQHAGWEDEARDRDNSRRQGAPGDDQG
ncbi:MAG: hypothetical protein ACRCY9_13840 [Phycicoccus sp.]